MKFIKKLMICLTVMIILPMYTISANAEYTDAYRTELLRLYETLDKQFTEFEMTEDSDVVLRFREFKVERAGYNVDGAIKPRDFMKIIAMLCGEHPRMLSSVNFLGSDLYPTNNPSLMSGIHLKRLAIDGTYEDMYSRINTRANEILGEIIEDGMTDLDKAFAVYRYLAQNVEDSSDRENLDRDTIYGSLILQSAACGGYADAYKFLMNKLGINCEICQSRSIGHIWNYIEIDGKWYHIDLTKSRNSSGNLTGFGFMRDDKEIKDWRLAQEGVVYDWESIHDYVVCDDDSYEKNYLFRILKGSNLENLYYDNGIYTLKDDNSFRNSTLKCMPKIITMPTVIGTGETANISNLKNARFSIYGSSDEYDLIIVSYDGDGRVLNSFKEKYDGFADVKFMDFGAYTPAENACTVKVFTWKDMEPLSEPVIIIE